MEQEKEISSSFSSLRSTCKLVVMASTTSTILDPNVTFSHLEFTIEPFIKNQLSIKLDTDTQLCPDFTLSLSTASSTSCPRGASCPYRHSSPSPLNFQPIPPTPSSAHARTVCKHWLRGLCKKGKGCDFMHEYHLRKMPECWFFAKYGFCSNGDEVSPFTTLPSLSQC